MAQDLKSAPTADERGHITVPRWIQLAGLPVLLIAAWLTLGVIGEAVFIFLAASLIALVLNPIVRLLQRLHVPRSIGVFLVYLAFVALLVGIGVLVVPPMLRQLQNLLKALPGMADSARGGIHRVQHLADRLHLHINVRARLVQFAQSLSRSLPSASGKLVTFGFSVVRTVAVTIIIVVVSVYMLLDARRISRFFSSHFPTGSQADGQRYADLAQDSVLNYAKAQLLLSAALGASAGLAMWFLSAVGAFPSGGKYAIFFGAWTAVMEAIPYIGPVMAAVPPTIVALFHSPLAAFWVIIAFLAIQQIEGHILVPVIMGNRFRVHPLVVIFAILAGNEIHGVTGMFLAIPLIPLVRDTITFFRGRVSFESWRTGSVMRDLGSGGRSDPPPP